MGYTGMDFLVVQWLRLCLPILGVQAPFLVGELRFPHVSWPKKPKQKTEAIFNKDFFKQSTLKKKKKRLRSQSI